MTESGAMGRSASAGFSTASWTGVEVSGVLVGCSNGGGGAGLFFPGAGHSAGGTSTGGAGALTRDGTGGGGVLETLGRLMSEEEPDSVEVVLIVREGAGDAGREDTLEGTSGSAEKVGRRGGGSGYRELKVKRGGREGDLTKNRVFVKQKKCSRKQKHSTAELLRPTGGDLKSDQPGRRRLLCFSGGGGVIGAARRAWGGTCRGGFRNKTGSSDPDL